MSLNTAHADHGVLIHQGECIVLFSDNVTVEFYGNDTPEFKGSKNGRMYLTTHRMIFNSKSNSDPLRSFSFPFISLEDVTVEQPMFSANFIKGKVRAQPNGNFIGEVKFKLTFKSGGAIEYGQAMLRAAHMASRHMSAGAPPPPYTPPTGPWHAAPPPAYQPSPQGYYGWVPPYAAFPDQPPPNSVFVSNTPPPYPGVGGVTYPTSSTGMNGAGFYPSAPPQYAGAQQPGMQPGYPGMQPGYPGMQPGYAGMQPGFQGMQPGYPPQQPGYPAQGPPPGYPGGFGFTEAASGTQTSRDQKAAEAAASAYYDPNRPQTAYVPPPYDHPPTYQESSSKKEN